VIHCREAFDDTMAILEGISALKRVVFHCFGGTAEQAHVVLERGYFISFTGVVTFKNAHKAREAVKVVPVDRLMVETDCPYMSPEPVRRQQAEAQRAGLDDAHRRLPGRLERPQSRGLRERNDEDREEVLLAGAERLSGATGG